jgi:pimeloyl-ACP methyl ester carboxylesterase
MAAHSPGSGLQRAKRLLLRALAGLALLMLALAVLAWWLLRPARPDAFYATPAEVPAEPGELLRQQTFDRAVPQAARAWRILHTTTDAQGAPTLSSAIVLLAKNAPPGPRPVVLWTHGTTGAVPGCAPSLLEEPLANLPALAALLERGWLLVAPDYAGLATGGVHPYLIGEGEARSALDAVRAARRMPEAQAGPQTVAWGHSQGGHAALWTGLLAPTYAPDVVLAGVAAAAPASDLKPLIDAAQYTPVGRILSAYVMHAYAGTYADVRWDAYVSGALAGAMVRDMAGRCLAGPQALVLAAQSLALRGSVFSAPPTGGALGSRLAQNTPDGPISQPLLIAQGEADELVLPTVQAQWAARRCAAGQALEYRRYPGLDHLSLVAPGSPFFADLARWTEERFAGKSWTAACPK